MGVKLRLGRICYINVLPIYYAMEQAYVPNGAEVIWGTPAELNDRMFAGRLDVSGISSLEYGRHFHKYLLLPDLSISSQGDVGSVLLFSHLPFHCLSGQQVLLSQSSATSAALVKIILAEMYGARPCYGSGPVSTQLLDGWAALLAIGDEALRLRATRTYPYFLDLGSAWYDLTGLPFVFGVWAVRRSCFAQHTAQVHYLHQNLLMAKDWGLKSLEEISHQAADLLGLDYQTLFHYYNQLNYDLQAPQRQGLEAFYHYLLKFGELPEMPQLRFI
ncbi:MAG: menaquinone biosynthesis protein [Deltaproteobacteria bacterium]|nr:menaquinone biosynthesis protein [Deltaproteobacteria bacterium]MBW1951852.1 menaquinone biosynthesis protein [Deltaproteobacteria bacterium]MBW1986568.1 menaquinone biosynthesis protein [Deltaproteobacteria bacterium]